MAKKDFDEYVLKMKAQYKELEKTLQILSKESEGTQTDIDYVERLKKTIEPIKVNYRRLMELKLRLDQPNRKDKLPAFKRRNAKLIKSLGESNSPEAVLEENQNILDSLKDYK